MCSIRQKLYNLFLFTSYYLCRGWKIHISVLQNVNNIKYYGDTRCHLSIVYYQSWLYICRAESLRLLHACWRQCVLLLLYYSLLEKQIEYFPNCYSLLPIIITYYNTRIIYPRSRTNCNSLLWVSEFISNYVGDCFRINILKSRTN